MPGRLAHVVDVDRFHRGVSASFGAFLRVASGLTNVCRRERNVTFDGPPGVSEIVRRCEQISAETFEILLDLSCAAHQARWGHVHTAAIRLDRDISGATARTRHVESQRSLDELAAAAIALRGSIERRVAASLHTSPSSAIIAANDDLVVLRCEDLLMTARNLESRPA